MKEAKNALIRSAAMLVLVSLALTTATFAWFYRDTKAGPTLEFVRTGDDRIPFRANAQNLSTVTVAGEESTGTTRLIDFSDDDGVNFTGDVNIAGLGEYMVSVEDDKKRVYFKTRIINGTEGRYRVSLYFAKITGTGGTIGVYGDYGGDDGNGYKAIVGEETEPDYVAPNKEWISWSDSTAYNVPVIRNIDVPPKVGNEDGTREIAWFLEADNASALNGITLSNLMCLNN